MTWFTLYFVSAQVCPQFDITWPDLTGSEHLYFFSRIKVFCIPCFSSIYFNYAYIYSILSSVVFLGKGMSGNDLDEEVRKNLAAVNLLDAADKKSREYRFAIVPLFLYFLIVFVWSTCLLVFGVYILYSI